MLDISACKITTKVFAEAGVPYKDIARLPKDMGGGIEKLQDFMKSTEDWPVAAPPFIKRGDVLLAQTSNICMYLGKKYGLAPEDETDLFRANQLSLTIADVVSEAHDTHHPISVSLYYEDQQDVAIERAKYFRELRIPKWLSYFEKVLHFNRKGGSKWLIGEKITYVGIL
jgi:glutathione S-transferase